MKGSETYLLPFLEGAQKYFIIPVYQRKYDWKIDNCRQLYEDLKRMLRENRPSHFFGSIVSAVEGNGGIPPRPSNRCSGQWNPARWMTRTWI